MKIPKELAIATYPQINLNGEENKLLEFFEDLKSKVTSNDSKNNETFCYDDSISNPDSPNLENYSNLKFFFGYSK